MRKLIEDPQRNATNLEVDRLRGTRILIVDDHLDLAANLAEILEDEGAQVVHAPTAAKAEELWDESFAIALVDIKLPDATGLELMPKLKAVGDGAAEVLLITGNASIDDTIEAVKIGAYDYVLKPFDPERLLASVTRAVRQVELTREADQLHAALADSEASLRGLVDAVQALLLELDEDGRVIRTNRAVLTCLDLPHAAVMGKNWFEHFVWHEDRNAMRRHFAAVLDDDAEYRGERVEYRVLPHGGLPSDVRWVSWHLALVRLESGEIRVYASGIDVTELRELERQKRLHEKLAAVGTLAAGLAHEIRNPLNAMSLQMQLLQRRMQKLTDEQRIRAPMDVINSEISRLSHLVDDFLRFARPTDVRAKSLDLVALVAQVIGFQRLDAEQRRVKLELESTQAEIHVQGDGEKLRQVMVNLLANAVEAASGDGTVRVHIEAIPDGARISVIDNGQGIPEEHLARIFEPFFSTKENGTGLGMAICHSLVSLHGGQIHVQSVEDEGSTVVIELPRVPPEGIPGGIFSALSPRSGDALDREIVRMSESDVEV